MSLTDGPVRQAGPGAGHGQGAGGPMSLHRLNRATLARQLLLRRERAEVVEAVRRVVALQAQEPASPYLALWNRVEGFDARSLDAAFRTGAIVKASLMRITLHAVLSSEYPTFHAAMQPTLRASRLHDRRFVATGLGIAEADALLGEVRRFVSRPRTNAEVEAFLTELIGALPEPRAWWALRTYGPFLHAPTGGPWSFGLRPSYVAAASDGASSGPVDSEGALGRLIVRYLEGFGPASVADFAQFALVPRGRARPVFEELLARGSVVPLGGDGVGRLFDVPGGEVPADDVAAPPRLLPMWDSILLAYADRGRVIPEAHRRRLIRTNGDVLPAILVDGWVAGVWRPVNGRIEVTAFEPLSGDAWRGLGEEAERLLRLLADRDPAVYRRYARWWASLPAAEVRSLPS